MDEKEILWRYDRAQNQNQMITILHELTLIPEYQIMILIINSGRELPERKVNTNGKTTSRRRKHQAGERRPGKAHP